MYLSLWDHSRRSMIVLLVLLLIISACAELSHYDYLQVGRNANSTEIKQKYKKLALQLHPDKFPLLFPNGTDEEREEMKDMFLKVQTAYEVLSDEEKRMKYDLSLDNPFGAHNDFDSPEVTEYNRYVQRVFHLYVNMKGRVRMYGKIEYDRPPIPVIKAHISVPVKYTFTGESLHELVPLMWCAGTKL